MEPDKTYSSLQEITDLVGFRIVAYFEDSLDSIAESIEKNFNVDLTHSVDKIQTLDSSQFGYRSLHYVCRLKSSKEMPEPLSNAPVEIQIRTILQHAWAEIEHDLGYKSQEGIPYHIRRKFSRLAGLLEIADEEFVNIKKYLSVYEETTNEKISQYAFNVPLDLVSLNSFVKTNMVRETDETIAKQFNIPMTDTLFFPAYLIKILEYVGLNNIKILYESLDQSKEELISFTRNYFEFTKKAWDFDWKNLDWFYGGYCLFFLGHYLCYKSQTLDLQKIEIMTNFYQHLDYPNDRTLAKKIATLFIESFP
mgnify:CR=1 FL=1